MESGDISSLIFILIILSSLGWSFVRGKGRSGVGSLMSGPKGFFESGGYRLPSDRNAQVQPPGADHEAEESVHRLRVEERLTRGEMMARGSGSSPRSTAVTRTPPGISPVTDDGKSATISAEQVREQLGRAKSAQMAVVLKDVFDRPVGLRDTGPK